MKVLYSNVYYLILQIIFFEKSNAFTVLSTKKSLPYLTKNNLKISIPPIHHDRHLSKLSETSSSSIPSKSSEEELDLALEKNNLQKARQILTTNPNTKLTKSRFVQIFQSIEERTSEADENKHRTVNIDTSSNYEAVNGGSAANIEFSTISPSRTEMTEIYSTLKELKHLRLYGATRDILPASGSKIVTPTLLEQVTDLSMKSLTPKPTSTLLVAGVVFGVIEGLTSLILNIDLSAMVISTLFLALLDKLIVNGAVFETFSRLLMPSLSQKILRHEAGHFLIAYLLGCPVEGCVLSAWAALQDARFGGQATTLSAGTSFFDPELSQQINGKKPLQRNSIDRFTIIVMAGIAAEAINFGQADGGAGDEMSLIRFLQQIRPSSGQALIWNSEAIRNQARWGALQSVLMLQQYKPAYEALVDALERGGGLGECIYAIEKAARDYDLQPLQSSLGTVLDKGLYGEWDADNTHAKIELTNQNFNGVNGKEENLSLNANSSSDTEVQSNDTQLSSEEILQKNRDILERKLEEIDEKLKAM